MKPSSSLRGLNHEKIDNDGKFAVARNGIMNDNHRLLQFVVSSGMKQASNLTDEEIKSVINDVLASKNDSALKSAYEFYMGNNASIVELHKQGSPCPLEYICNVNQKVNCTILQKFAEVGGLGKIHDGLYCPANEDNYLNCPIGHYCPTPKDEPVKCPAGKFCPHKTATPQIICKSCEEGSTELARDFYGWVVVIVVFILVVFLVIFTLFKRKRAESYKDLKEKTADSIDSVAIKMKGREPKARLEKLGPQLDLIYRRLDSLEDKDAKINADIKKRRKAVAQDVDDTEKRNNEIQYDAKVLFDALDTDGNGVLCYDEINRILDLDDVQLRQFVRRMNIKGKTFLSDNTSSKEVSRRCFVYHFIDVLEETSNFGPTKEEAATIYDEIVSVRVLEKNKVHLDDLYHSPTLTRFLSDIDIHDLTLKFRDVSEENKSTAKSYARSIIHAPVVISRDVFIEHYGEFLKQVTRDHDDSAEEEGKLQHVDITFENLCLDINVGSKTVKAVNNVSGRLQAGTMTALFGGSGAGKTSLLNALCGRAHYGTVTGKVYINGQEDSSIEEISDSFGFVPQDDIVYAELTVRENFIYSGRFQLPAGTSREEIEDLADETLANLGLIRVANSPVGDVRRRGVSGGEKKRVNIGLELMSKPSAIFLDEPTSGGVTLCSVIHQPRKSIFDLFDSIILLGAGGKMVYHGPADGAVPYFTSKNYVLPAGESVADWLIDISSGRLPPQKDQVEDNEDVAVSSNSEMLAAEEAKVMREGLYKEWKNYFASLDNVGRAKYEAPAPYGLPPPKTRPSLLVQFWIQLLRIIIVAQRNWLSKLIDTVVIVGAVALICAMAGSTQVTVDHDPILDFNNITNVESITAQFSQFGELFRFSVQATQRNLLGFANMLGIVTTVLIGLTATKSITAKQLEFYREAGSGYDVTAYFLAVNVASTLEHCIQAVAAALFANWIRNSITSWVAYYVNFVLLAWLAVSWAITIPIFVPQESAIVITALIMAVFGFLFSGFSPTSSGMSFTKIYADSPANPFFPQIFCAFLSVPRFFLETSAVNENRCLPVQTGYTYDSSEAFLRVYETTAFGFQSLGHNDGEVTDQSCLGWYWSVLPSIFVGLSIRWIAVGAMHACNRSKQAKGSIWKEKHIYAKVAVYVAMLSILVGLAVWFIIRNINVKDSVFDVDQLQSM